MLPRVYEIRDNREKLVEEDNYLDNPELLCSIYRQPDTAIRELEEHEGLLPTALQQLVSRSRLQCGSWWRLTCPWCWGPSYTDFLIHLERNLQNVWNFIGVNLSLEAMFCTTARCGWQLSLFFFFGKFLNFY